MFKIFQNVELILKYQNSNNFPKTILFQYLSFYENNFSNFYIDIKKIKIFITKNCNISTLYQDITLDKEASHIYFTFSLNNYDL